jgi:DNA processing protein
MSERTVLRFDAGDPVLAAAAWSRLAEPGDSAAGAVVRGLGGATSALTWLASGSPAPSDVHDVSWDKARDRWLPRLVNLDPRRELDLLARLGGRLVLPGESEWPPGLDDLGLAAPQCLWVVGGPLGPSTRRSVAVVGARACTAYGRHVAADFSAGLVERSVTVVSGGAYGIDAAAHQGALAGGGPTLAVLAGGLDRPYPAGNAALLAEVARRGAMIAEVPPGSAPTRSRFLMRNRLIAALTRGTVVVEAAWRSGALSTAGHAAALLRPVGVVPGPVTSMASAGCHRLLRETDAVCVTDAAEVVELIGDLGADLAPERPADADAARRSGPGEPPEGLDQREARLFEALPLRGQATVESLARTAGLAQAEVRAGLGYLELAGLVVGEGGRYRRARG